MARRNSAAPVALGGVLAALAVVVMCMGTMIPVATFVCPMVCICLLAVVLRSCDEKIAWAWYGAVAVLSLLLAPDKEAAAVFAFLGYYPIVKPKMEKLPISWLWKCLLFNVSVLVMYCILLYVFGMNEIAEDYAELGLVMTIAMLVMGNVTFFMMDYILSMRFSKAKKNG